MDKLTSLLIDAERNNIIIDNDAPENIKALIFDCDGQPVLGISKKAKMTQQEKTYCLAHEMGHYHTGTYYTFHSPLQLKDKYEYQADVWMVKFLVPPDELRQAIDKGYTEPWQLAEYFDVPECVILRAAYIYKCKEIL